MRPRVTVLTLGVDDLERALRFYRALGLESEGIVGTEFEYGAVAFFPLNEGTLLLAVWPRASLAHESNVGLGPASATEVAIGHNVASKGEVDAVMAEAERAGATITDRARDRFWSGYSGCFQDPDGHVWEIAWNPTITLPG